MSSDFKIDDNVIESHYMAGSLKREKKTRKVDITEFGLVLLILYLNSPKARQISAEILYCFFSQNLGRRFNWIADWVDQVILQKADEGLILSVK